MKKTIVIGATSGIGRGIAELLAEDGCKVGITGRRTELLEELKKGKPDLYIVKTMDVCDTRTTIQNLQELIDELGGLDLVIISSGTGYINEPLDYEKEETTINTNVLGFTNIVDWVFKYFVEQKSGHLAAITSIAGLRGSRYAPSYSASKSYQIKYLEAMRQKANHLKLPIYITDIRPGFVDTAMAQSKLIFWVAPVQKASRQIYNAIRRKRKIVYVTKRWRLLAIVFKLIPRPITDRM